MKKTFFGILATIMISANSFAINSIVEKTESINCIEENKIETSKEELLAQADMVDFICWLFGGHCW